MLKLRFMIAIIVFSLLSAKAAVMPTSAIVNSPSADELSAARRLMTSATQLPSTGNPPSTISPTVKLTSRSSNVSPSYDKNHPSSLFPSPYDSYGSSSPPSSANPSNTYPSSLLAPSSACPSTGSSSFPSGVLPSSYSSSPLSQNIVPASINPTLLTASSSICPTTTSKRYPSSLFPSSYGGYSSRSSSPTVNPSSSEDAASLIPTSLPPSSYSSYTGVSSPYPSASPAPTLTSYPSSPTSLVPSTINLQTFRPTGYPSYEQTLISTSPYGCPSSANGFVPSSAPSTPSTRIGSTYPHGNFFPDSSSMPTIETDTSLLRSTVMHFCKANGYWDAVYGIQSGYIIWLAALTIMWSALACLSFALVSFGSINSLELMIIVSTDISFSLLRIFLIISITKNIGAGRFSCVELIFMHPFVNHEPNPLETLLLAAEGIVLACNLLLGIISSLPANRKCTT